MEKDELRNLLKNNFLKNLLFRIDFNGLIDADIEQFILDIRKEVIRRGYVNLKETFEQTVNIELNEGYVENVSANQDLQKVYIFSSDNGKELKIFKSAIIFDINIDKNETFFSDYLPLISYVIKQLMALDYVNFTRIGLRKVNSCIVVNKKGISKFFSKNVFCMFNEYSLISQAADEIRFDTIGINYNRIMQQGISMMKGEQRIAYQIVLDIDAFINDYDVIQHFIKEKQPEEILKELNNYIFNVYIDSLTEEFIDKLKEDKFYSDEILGVNKNV